MSSATHAASGQLSFGGLMSRILLTLAIWAGLVFATMHYVGHVIPTALQVSEAKHEAAELAAKALAAPAPAAPVASAAPAAASAKPATSAAAPAPAVASAAPATSAGTAAPAASAAPKAAPDKKIPKDVLLAGYNRTALTNVAIFYSIVISVFCIGVIILQVFKYKHIEEEAAH